MQQLNFIKPHVLEWHEVPAPVLPDGKAVIVRPLTVSTCDMDGIVIGGGMPLRGPVPLGHEGEGVIIDAGDKVRRFKVGDRVIIPWKIACGSCQQCGRGHTSQCVTVPPEDAFGWGPTAPHWGGFLSDAVVVPWADHMLTALPSDVDPVLACGVADNISDGWRAVAPHLAQRPGGTVLVAGGTRPGSIGLYAAGIAAALGASRVVYASADSALNAVGKALGCSVVDLRETPLSEIKGDFDITVDALGRPDAIPALLARTGGAGVCTSIAGVMYRKAEIVFPVYEMYRRSISFHTGWVHTHSIIDEPLELIRSGKFDPSPVTTRIVAWEDVIDALTQPFIKVIVQFKGMRIY
jgi:threonine dehydrogenase-like Zn-dependent dehydrogenase